MAVLAVCVSVLAATVPVRAAPEGPAGPVVPPPSEPQGETEPSASPSAEASVSPVEAPAAAAPAEASPPPSSAAVPPPAPRPAAATPADSEPQAPPSDTAGARPSAGPAAAPSDPLAHGSNLDQPPPALPPPPRRRGWGLIVTGAAFSGLLLAARDGILTTGLVFAAFEGGSYFGQFMTSVTAPLDLLVVASGSLVAGGLYRKGRYEARHRHRALDRADLRRRARIGWVSFGIAAAVLAGQAGLAYGIGFADFDDDRGYEALYWSHYLLSYVGTAVLVAGVLNGPYASGLLEGMEERAWGSVTVVPAPLRSGGGVSVAGRF